MRRVLAFYKFVAVSDPLEVQRDLLLLGEKLGVKGTILLASEGVNGTIVGELEALQQMQQALGQRFGELPFKWSELNAENLGFYRYKVKIKPEIVTLGVPDLDMQQTGEHVSVERWHQLLDDPDVVVIDTRNTYEIDIGTFPQAVNPNTTNFRDFPQWVAEHLDPQTNKQVAMFCTGGIRCEKASAYMQQAGFDKVYQLDGGVLRYLEQVEVQENRWQGECFVFDQRVSVTAALEQGHFQQCFACRHPVSDEDMASEFYEQGVSCPHCYSDEALTPESAARLASLRERQRQVELAEQRGAVHIGQPQEQHAPMISDSQSSGSR